MRLVQFKRAGGDRAVAVVDGDTLRVIDDATTYVLAEKAIHRDSTLEAVAGEGVGSETESYEAVIAEGRILPPLDHPDRSRLLVTGTGLTHLGSASTRDAMHS